MASRFMLLIPFGVLFVFTVPVFAALVEADVFAVLDGKCQPSCTVSHGGDIPFTLSYRSYKEGFETYLDLRIGDSSFKGLVISPQFIADGSLSFSKHRFPKHTTYGLTSDRSAHNAYVHYFIRMKNGFNYLGHFPSLHYDTELGRFLSFEKVGEEIIRFYYRFEGDRLVEDEDY